MVFEGIKGFYSSIEEKWYGVIDKINSKVPIYGVVDAIDSVIPSLLLFIILIILIIAFGAYFILSSNQAYTVTLTIQTPDRKPLNDTIITAILLQNGEAIKDLSSRTDSDGIIVFKNIMKGQSIRIDINSNRGTFSNTYEITSDYEDTILLQAPPIKLEPITKTIFVRSDTGITVSDPIPLTFSCENSTIQPTPTSATFTGTGIRVTEPVNCRLQATFQGNSKYNAKTYKIDSIMKDIYLEKPVQPATTLTIKIRSDGFPISDTSFSIKLSGENIYGPTTTGSTSQAQFNVEPGQYTLTITDPSGKYGIVSKTISVSSTKEEIIEVSRNIIARATIRVVDARTNNPIENAIVTLKNSFGIEMTNTNTDANGSVLFTFIDTGEYKFAAKKLGDLNGGYYAKEVTQTINGDLNITLGLDAVTRRNAGKTIVTVIDQDGLPVINAKVMLKYKDNDGIVELLQEKNYSQTDINGQTTFIAGKVDGLVYAYAIKGPFNGFSTPKQIIVDQENTFKIIVQVGSANVKINVIDESGTKIDGTAEILTIDGKTASTRGVSGIISIENGTATRSVKAGQTVYVKIKAENYLNYYTLPVTLWPNQTYTFDATMKKTILEPEIKFGGIYNETGTAVQTMAPGKKYYAKLTINTDKDYAETILHFRAGIETLMDNDVIQLDNIEAANITLETRGISYDQNKGYSFDSNNTTDGPAKWTNILLTHPGAGVREVKVWFRITRTATPNSIIQFFYRGQFDEIRAPKSTITEDFYADCSSTLQYYVGAESTCNPTDAFCVNSEWFYSMKDELYIDAPYVLHQLVKYKYHFTLFNNSGIDYGQTGNTKPIYLSIRVKGDDSGTKKIRINGYEVKDTVKTTTNNTTIYAAENIQLSSFEKNTMLDTTLSIEGMTTGADIIEFELKSDGKIIYSKQTSYSIAKDKDFQVSIDPGFVPALMNTELTVEVVDEKGEYLPGATITSYAKEPGYDEYQISTATTDRLGRAIVYSGALFKNSKVIVEILAENYSRQRYALTVSNEVLSHSPNNLYIQLNTITNRETTEKINFTNQTTFDLTLKSISLDADLKDIINEDAMNGYFEALTQDNKIIKAEKSADLYFLKLKLVASITQASLPEPISTTGTIKLTFEEKDTRMLFDIDIPLTIEVSSEANPSTDCLALTASDTSVTTEKAQARFDFELTNACSTNNAGIPLELLTVKSNSEINGVAEISIRNAGGDRTGRTALDGSNRTLLNTIKPGEKLFVTLTYAPDDSEIGKAVGINISFQAKFNGKTIKSSPQTKTFTVNVINLKECLNIESDSAPAEFTGQAKLKIDASGCLNQTIDVILCKGDTRCSGGVEGGITLSSKSFTLKGNSKEIKAYGPSLPGTYGVTVHARTRGTGGFTYIGELPVSFKERNSAYFTLNKYELTLIGAGSYDSVMLTNRMLTQDVKVRADECIWGKKDAEFSWSKALTGAMLGATIGNMIGSALPKNSELGWGGSPKSTNVSEEFDASNLGDTPGKVTTIKDKSGWEYSYSDGKIYATKDDSSFILKKDFWGNRWSKVSGASVPAVTKSSISGDATIIIPSQVKSSTLPKNAFLMPKIIHFAGVDQKASVAHFEADKDSGGSSYLQFASTLIFAILGGWLMGQGTYKCADNYDTQTRTDYVILLQPDVEVSVTPPDGSSITYNNILPGDAGALSFTIPDANGYTITPSWDFQDASISSEEIVAIDFNNNGINDNQARYGVLTINATMHLHGGSTPKVSTDSSTTYTSTSTYDVQCYVATFGNYWIGAGPDAGKCTGITQKNYQQKYHMRVITGESKGEDAYLKKASSCYFGSLTGSTGEEAVPKILLNWNWSAINDDTCDYGNEEFVYCDGTQALISLTKKLAKLDDFLEANQNKFSCPSNILEDQVIDNMNEINSKKGSVPSGFIGVEDIIMSVGDTTTASVIVNNKSGSDTTSYVSVGWAGNGGTGEDKTDLKQMSFPPGKTTLTFQASTPKYEGMYYFTAVVNGPMGDSKMIQRAFVNRIEKDNNCWLEQTTRKQYGYPGLLFFVNNMSSPSYTTKITNSSDVYSAINFGMYLTKDAYTSDFLNDFKAYYKNRILQVASTKEKQILNYFDSGKIKIVKKYSGDNQIEAGLYDVWINLDAPNNFRVIDGNNTNIEITLLLVKKPSINWPFYNMPFDGMVGEQGGRQGYGTTYTNNDTKNITISNNGGMLVNTFYNAASNGITEATTYTKTTFEAVNTAVGTRGQVASASVSENTATLTLTPTYATPVIAKYTLNDTTGRMLFGVESINSTTTGGNLNYWTGAAKSKDFYGSNAVEVYSDAPDNRFTKFGDNVYGFEFNNASRTGTMYLKTIFFTPGGEVVYTLKAQDDITKFWTPNTSFSSSVELSGIKNMQYNSKGDYSYISSLQDLFDAVKNQVICVSNDGTDASFWWNPRTLENTQGLTDSLATKETALIGVK